MDYQTALDAAFVRIQREMLAALPTGATITGRFLDGQVNAAAELEDWVHSQPLLLAAAVQKTDTRDFLVRAYADHWSDVECEPIEQQEMREYARQVEADFRRAVGAVA